RILLRRETLRAVAARAPLLRGVLQPGVEHIAAAGDPQGDGVGRAPFVERVGIEEADERVERLAGAGQRARRGQRVLERFGGQLFRVVRRLGRGGDETAHLARFAAGVRAGAEPEILADGPFGDRLVVVVVPVGVAVEVLDALVGARLTG